jgi:hypothetical protein
MCWNAEISLKTFIVGTIAAIICLYLNAIPKSLIFITWSFTLIQLLEYFAWTYIGDSQKIYYLSVIGLLLILVQLFMLCYYANNYQHELLISLFAYVILFCIFCLPETKFNMKKGKNGHLEWEWLNFPPVFIFFGLLLYCIPIAINKNYIGLAFTVSTMIISLYHYYKYNAWATMWCYFSNIIWFFFVAFSLYRKYYAEKVLFWNY